MFRGILTKIINLLPNQMSVYYISRANRCFENVAQIGFLGMTVTNENFIQEEIKRKLNSGNACYLSV
jgi:hypothetical protein